MINTFLSEEAQLLKKEFEQFAQNILASSSSEKNGIEKNCVRILEQIAEAGYLRLNIPTNYGGKSAPLLHSVLLAETIARYEPGLGVYLAYQVAITELLRVYGSEQYKNIYLPKLAAGEVIGTIAYLENGDANKGTKILSENGTYLNGSKELVVLTQCPSSLLAGQNYLANLVMVLADDKLILLNDLSAAGIRIDAQNDSNKSKSIKFSRLVFEKYKFMPEDLLTGSKEITDEALTFARDIVKTILAAASLGMVDRALSETVSHVQVAKRDGNQLSQSQSALWKLANAATDISAARLLTYRAAWSKDESKAEFSRYAAMAKAYSAKVANQHIGESLQILLPFADGEYFDLTCFYIDSKILETFDRTNDEEKVLLSNLLGI